MSMFYVFNNCDVLEATIARNDQCMISHGNFNENLIFPLYHIYPHIHTIYLEYFSWNKFLQLSC